MTGRIGNLVYLLGAGSNQVIKNHDGFYPPLSNDFFQIAIQSEPFKTRIKAGDRTDLHILFDYINHEYGISLECLKEKSLNLEQFVTDLDTKINKLEPRKDEDYYRIKEIDNIFKRLLSEVIQSFEIFAYGLGTLQKFAQILHKAKPTILTFNYDCILECALELVSGLNPSALEEIRGYDKYKKAVEDHYNGKKVKLLPDEVGYHRYMWDRRLSYGVEFDEVAINFPFSLTLKGKDYYQIPHNTLYQKSILKLHGSLNWFTYLPFNQRRKQEYVPIELGNKKDSVLLKDDSHHGAGFFDYRDNDGYLISPLIITPTLYKDKYYNHRVFRQLWDKARIELQKCDELVIIGYSFSDTDKTIRKLLSKTLKKGQLKRLIVVNRNPSKNEFVKKLCSFEGEDFLYFPKLEDYLAYVDESAH